MKITFDDESLECVQSFLVTLDKLKLLASIVINNYAIVAIMPDVVSPDTSLIEHALVTDLKHAGVEPDDIEKVIVDMDWSNYLTNNLIGKRERSLVMDSIKEIYDDISREAHCDGR